MILRCLLGAFRRAIFLDNNLWRERCGPRGLAVEMPRGCCFGADSFQPECSVTQGLVESSESVKLQNIPYFIEECLLARQDQRRHPPRRNQSTVPCLFLAVLLPDVR